MDKTVIIINGRGGVGKDTLCNFAGNRYKVRNISSVDPIKEIAAQYGGWNGQKDPRSRKFLADLKQLFTDYNDLPFQYQCEQYRQFMQTDEEIMFVHIREASEIAKLAAWVPTSCVTLLVQRGEAQAWGNASDDHVAEYSYDYVYQNTKPLTEAEQDFCLFLQSFLEKDGDI